MRPLTRGALVGAAILLAVLAPSYLWGNLPQILADGATIVLIVPLFLLLVPGAMAGYLATRAYGRGADAWRFNTGLLLGVSLAASLVLWVGAHEAAPAQRLAMSLFGGPFLAGFWLWLGALMGAATAQRRPAQAVPADRMD